MSGSQGVQGDRGSGEMGETEGSGKRGEDRGDSGQGRQDGNGALCIVKLLQ